MSSKKNKMKKKNGFVIFAEERKPKILAAGHQIPGGFKDLAVLCSDDWKALPQEEKDRYGEIAKKHNGSNGLGTGATGSATSKGKPNPEGMRDREKDNATLLKSIFEVDSDKWMDQPIVVCSFSLYFSPDDGSYLPAEIGLAAFSLRNGMLDNYGRIIDPGELPLGRGKETKKVVDTLGVPMPGSNNHFRDLDPIMYNLQGFCAKYQGQFHTGEYFVFALDSELELVTRCLQWLFSKSGHFYPVRVLSLSQYAHLGSLIGNQVLHRSLELASTSSAGDMDDRPNACSIVANVSAYRTVGEPLSKNFSYHERYPMTKYGIFVGPHQVDELLSTNDNYRYFEEVCCVYHCKHQDGVQHCALNKANRHAYYIMEVLTLSNTVPIIEGAHFPVLSKPEAEKNKRHNWLIKWGITKLEMEMPDCPPPDPEDEPPAPRPRSGFFTPGQPRRAFAPYHNHNANRQPRQPRQQRQLPQNGVAPVVAPVQEAASQADDEEEVDQNGNVAFEDYAFAGRRPQQPRSAKRRATSTSRDADADISSNDD